MLCKLYPWEWLIADEFGAASAAATMRVIEPAWKMLLSNKGLLPILWELNPGHPNLLPASFDRFRISGDYVQKPLYSREGANVAVYRGGEVLREDGSYGDEGWVYQAYAPIPRFGDSYVTIGSWIVGDEPAGIGMREDATPDHPQHQPLRSALLRLSVGGITLAAARLGDSEEHDMNNLWQSIAGFPTFLLYFALALALLALFVAIYVRVTPYREIRLIREGNIAAVDFAVRGDHRFRAPARERDCAQRQPAGHGGLGSHRAGGAARRLRRDRPAGAAIPGSDRSRSRGAGDVACGDLGRPQAS